MNCKSGDLAVIVRSINGPVDAVNVGRVFRVTRLSVRGSQYAGTPCWEAENLKPTDVLRDDCLKPIRPGDVTDEEVRDLYAPDRSMKDSPPSDTTSPNKQTEAA